jgi:hypothetical protein
VTAKLAAVQAFDVRRSAATPFSDRRVGFGRHIAVQRDGDGPSHDGAARLVRQVVSTQGQPLDPDTRALMGSRLGHDFSNVRVHTDSDAARSAAAIGANAYTAGNHIVFGAGQFVPSASRGQRIVAHELAHIVQQSQGFVAGTDIGGGVVLSHPEDKFERDAMARAEQVMTGSTTPARPLTPINAREPGLAAQTIAVQRDAAGVIGAIAGVASAALAIVGLIAAFGAWKRPKNPPPTSGGIAINVNPNPLFPAAGPAEKTPEAIRAFRSAIEGPPQTHKILDLNTDTKNHAVINLMLKTDGKTVVSGVVQQGETKNYGGGSAGSSAVVNISETAQVSAEQLTPQPPTPDKPAAPAIQTWGVPEKIVSPPSGSQAPAGGQQAPPSPPQPAAVSETILAFNGTNTLGEGAPQGFAGDIKVTGDGKVECLRCAPTNAVGIADKVGSGPDSYGKVAYTYEGFKASDGAPGPAPVPTPAPAPPAATTPVPSSNSPQGPGDFPPPPKNLSVA